MMERALKERIVGAAILVLFAVLVVPIFLDGPPGSTETVTERVLLPGQDATKTQTVVLERNRTEPVPTAAKPTESAEAQAPRAKRPDVKKAPVVKEAAVAEEAAVAAPAIEEKPETRPAKDVPDPVKARVTAPPTASVTGMWAVQLGSFSNKDNAEKLAADLRKQGYAAFLSRLSTDAGSLHRVRIGPQKDRKGAETVASRLEKAGYSGQVLPHP